MQSLETFRAFFEASPDAVFAVNTQGHIVMASNRAKTLFGYNPNELVGKEIETLIPESFAAGHQNNQGNFLQKPGTYEIGLGQELLAKRKDGSTFFAEISRSPIKVKEPIVLVSVRDVSNQKELFNQLKVSNDQFKGAFDHSAIGMALVSTEGKWLKVNRKVCEIVGYEEEELLKKTFQDITHPDDLNIDLANLGRVLTNKIDSYQIEKRYFNKSGKIVWVLLSVSLSKNTDGKPLHFVSQIKDITERKKAEKDLKESEQRWQFALEGAGDGVWDWYVPTNEVYFSARWKRMLGYDELEQITTYAKWDSLVHPDDKETRNNKLGELLNGTKKAYINELRLKCSNQEYLWVLARGKVVEWDENGKPTRIIGTHSDISGQKEKQQQLQESFDIINEQNKRLTNFAHIVSHNLRSHTGNFQLILNLFNNAENEDEKAQMLKLLKDNAQNLSNTIEHLNDVVQIQVNKHINKTTVHLNTYISKTMEVLAGEINQQNVYVINNVSDDVKVDYNPAYMESILLNFLSNGIKYSHPDRRPEIKIDTIVENNRLILQIADNGKGINLERNRTKLFGLYKTFHGNTDAKGVGLFITKNQVEAMGGKIEVESRVNLGTVFKIYLT
jgi:PAS domain S-box-containing protein